LTAPLAAAWRLRERMSISAKSCRAASPASSEEWFTVHSGEFPVSERVQGNANAEKLRAVSEGNPRWSVGTETLLGILSKQCAAGGIPDLRSRPGHSSKAGLRLRIQKALADRGQVGVGKLQGVSQIIVKGAVGIGDFVERGFQGLGSCGHDGSDGGDIGRLR